MSEPDFMGNKKESGQTQVSADKNAKFFLDKYQNYRKKV